MKKKLLLIIICLSSFGLFAKGPQSSVLDKASQSDLRRARAILRTERGRFEGLGLLAHVHSTACPNEVLRQPTSLAGKTLSRVALGLSTICDARTHYHASVLGQNNPALLNNLRDRMAWGLTGQPEKYTTLLRDLERSVEKKITPPWTPNCEQAMDLFYN